MRTAGILLYIWWLLICIYLSYWGRTGHNSVTIYTSHSCPSAGHVEVWWLLVDLSSLGTTTCHSEQCQRYVPLVFWIHISGEIFFYLRPIKMEPFMMRVEQNSRTLCKNHSSGGIKTHPLPYNGTGISSSSCMQTTW